MIWVAFYKNETKRSYRHNTKRSTKQTLCYLSTLPKDTVILVIKYLVTKRTYNCKHHMEVEPRMRYRNYHDHAKSGKILKWLEKLFKFKGVAVARAYLKKLTDNGYHTMEDVKFLTRKDLNNIGIDI